MQKKNVMFNRKKSIMIFLVSFSWFCYVLLYQIIRALYGLNLETIIKHQPVYKNILINVHTA